MSERCEYIQKALKHLDLNYEGSYPLNTINDLNILIGNKELDVDSMKAVIERSKQVIEEAKIQLENSENDLSLLNSIKHQVEVEEYKCLNQDLDIY